MPAPVLSSVATGLPASRTRSRSGAMSFLVSQCPRGVGRSRTAGDSDEFKLQFEGEICGGGKRHGAPRFEGADLRPGDARALTEALLRQPARLASDTEESAQCPNRLVHHRLPPSHQNRCKVQPVAILH